MSNIDFRLAPSGLGDRPFALHSTGHAQGVAGDRHEWRDTEWVLVEAVFTGRGHLSVGSRTWDLKAGDVYVLSREEASYGSHVKEPWTKVFFIASGPLVTNLLPLYLHGSVVFEGANLGPYLKQMHQLSITGGQDTHERASVLFLELLIQLADFSSRSKQCPDEIREVLLYIDRNYEKKITVEELAKRVFMSKAHLIRMFRAQVGVTPYEHVIQRRIDAAKAMLSTTNLRIREIADRLCFADEYYFSNTFKKRVGVAPTIYRKGQ